MTHRAITVVALFAILAVSTEAFAQESAHTTAAARTLFHEGVACADHDDWTCAVERFEQAYALRASPIIASNLAAALTHVGRMVEASERYRSVVRDESAAAELRTQAERRIAELADRIGRLTVRVEGPLDDVALTIDGRPVVHSLVGIAAPSDVGEHVVEARRGGALVASARAAVLARQTAEVTLTVPAAPRVVPDLTARDPGADVLATGSEPPPRHTEIYEEWWLWTIVGVVVVGAAVGITAGVLADPGTTLPMGSLGTIDGR